MANNQHNKLLQGTGAGCDAGKPNCSFIEIFDVNQTIIYSEIQAGLQAKSIGGLESTGNFLHLPLESHESRNGAKAN